MTYLRVVKRLVVCLVFLACSAAAVDAQIVSEWDDEAKAKRVVTLGGEVRQKTLASSVTTNTTSTAVAVPIGAKSFYGQVVGTGAVTQTQAIYCDIDSDAAHGVLLATLTLSGTTRDQAMSSVVTAACSYLYVTTTNTTGTSATGAVYVMY